MPSKERRKSKRSQKMARKRRTRRTKGRKLMQRKSSKPMKRKIMKQGLLVRSERTRIRHLKKQLRKFARLRQRRR